MIISFDINIYGRFTWLSSINEIQFVRCEGKGRFAFNLKFSFLVLNGMEDLHRGLASSIVDRRRFQDC